MIRTWFFGLRAPPPNHTPSRPRPAWRRLLDLEPLEERCLLSTLTVNGSQQYQTVSGFGTNLSSEAWNNGALAPSLDILLNHGYKLFRVIVEPVQGWEDTNPNTGQYSDANPNWPYYNNLYGTSTKFTNLWNTISYLNSHGATVWVNLQSDAPAWMTDHGGATGSMGQDHEADWATMVATMMDYAVNTAHVHIDALAPMNEPDNGDDPVQGPQVGATQYVRMLDTLETKLQSYGLGSTLLVGPDNTSPDTSVSSYIPAMLADSFLMPHVMQFGFHTYGGAAEDGDVTDNSTYPGRQILTDEYDGDYFDEDTGQRATPSQLWTQADESFQNLMDIVDAGENGAIIWDGVDNFYEYYQEWSAHGLISYDWTAPDPTAPSDYGTTPRLYANAQMFQFVTPGSVVIGSDTSAGNFLNLAFKGPNGQITIVGENTGSSTQSITGTLTGGLNTPLFNMYFTNSSLNEQQQANVAVSNNSFNFSVPADTIFTLTTQTAPSVTGMSPSSGLIGGGQSVTITGSGFTGATGVFFGGVAAGLFTINSDTQITAITPAAPATGAVDVTVATAAGTSATSPSDQFTYLPPSILISAASRKTIAGVPNDYYLNDGVGIEARPGGPTQLILQFSNPVTLGPSFNLALSEGTGAASISGGNLIVNLSGVADETWLNVGISGLLDSGGNPVSASVQVGVLDGDVNGDGVVDIQDFSIVANHWQNIGVGLAAGDLSGDGTIDIADFTLVANDWQHTLAATPSAISNASPPITSPTTNTSPPSVSPSALAESASGPSHHVLTKQPTRRPVKKPPQNDRRTTYALPRFHTLGR